MEQYKKVGNLKVRTDLSPEKQALVNQIAQNYVNQNKKIDAEARKGYLRGGLGSVVSGLSFHPIMNIPYVGTGVGGAMYDLGQGIVAGDKAKDLAKRAGRGFVIGETVGAIPYVGKAAAKTKAGQAVGKQLNKTVEKVAQNPAVQKAYDTLMTDIKAFNPNKQIMYHGSPYDFEKFSNEAIGTGEGAQAHGLGHYAALNKDVAEGYRKRLGASNTETDIEELKDLNKGFKYNLLARGKEDTLNKLNELIEANKNIPDKLQEFEKYKNIVENFNENNLLPSGQLYKLSVPKDDVMLREGATFAQQPKKVQDILKREYFDKINENLPLKHQKTPEQILDVYGGDDFNNLRRFLVNKTGLEEKELTDLLHSQGIKGISYNGGIDGEARVIFNPDDIVIGRKYYNQPTLKDIYNKFINSGAIAGAITNP